MTNPTSVLVFLGPAKRMQGLSSQRKIQPSYTPAAVLFKPPPTFSLLRPTPLWLYICLRT
jgi:hypothetical protein